MTRYLINTCPLRILIVGTLPQDDSKQASKWNNHSITPTGDTRWHIAHKQAMSLLGSSTGGRGGGGFANWLLPWFLLFWKLNKSFHLLVWHLWGTTHLLLTTLLRTVILVQNSHQGSEKQGSPWTGHCCKGPSGNNSLPHKLQVRIPVQTRYAAGGAVKVSLHFLCSPHAVFQQGKKDPHPVFLNRFAPDCEQLRPSYLENASHDRKLKMDFCWPMSAGTIILQASSVQRTRAKKNFALFLFYYTGTP